MDVDWIKERIGKNEYEYSDHADYEREQDKLSLNEVEQAIFAGDIIEDYPHDKRGASCLIMGYISGNIPVHIVCAKVSKNILRIITVYIPTPPKWVTPHKRRVRK